MKRHYACAMLAMLIASACTNTTRSSAADSAPQTSTASTATIVPANGPVWRVDDSDGVFPASGSVAEGVPCQKISLNLQQNPSATQPQHPKLIGKPSTCPHFTLYMGYLRSTLFIEGLDENGARLFVATGMNPQHQDVEAPPPPGGQMSWHSVDTPMPVLSTVIDAPVTPALVRMRWYDIDENFQPRLMGQSRWADVQSAAP